MNDPSVELGRVAIIAISLRHLGIIIGGETY
jgi:hypothetical protein